MLLCEHKATKQSVKLKIKLNIPVDNSIGVIPTKVGSSDE